MTVSLGSPARVSPFKRIRCLEFAEQAQNPLPEVRRVDLRTPEQKRRPEGTRSVREIWKEDFLDLGGADGEGANNIE